MQLFLIQKTMIEDAYAASVKGIAEGTAKTQGVALGEQAAAAVQADRASGGTNAPDTYRPMTTAGVWVPTTSPIFAQYGAREAVGIYGSRPIPAGPSAAALGRAVCARLQRDEDARWRQEHRTPPRKPRQSNIGHKPIWAQRGKLRRVSFRKRKFESC